MREIIIPHSVAEIDDWAFTRNRFEKITIGAQVTVHKDTFDDGFSDFYRWNNKKAGTYQFADKRWRYSGDNETNALALAASKKRVTAAESGPWNNFEPSDHPANRYDRMIIYANEGIRLNPEDSEKWSLRGQFRSDRGDREGAVADYTEAIRLNPQAAKYWLYRGTTYIEMREYDQAIADLTEVLRLNPESIFAYNNRAIAYDRKGDKEKALADIDRALALDPDYETAQSNRDIILNGPRLQLWYQ